ncbi:YggT family protein [Azospirillaceae bacterium]
MSKHALGGWRAANISCANKQDLEHGRNPNDHDVGARSACQFNCPVLGCVARNAEARPTMEPFFHSLFTLVYVVLDLYVWMLIAAAVLSWLVTFHVVNTHNRGVYIIGDFLFRVTEPVLSPIRRHMPDFGGVDLSPIVVILGVWFIQSLLRNYHMV